MTSEKRDILDFLARTPPFSGAGAEDLEALAAACSLRRYPAGATVFGEGDPAAAGWVVLSGRARVLGFLAAARTFQIELLGPGQPFGLFCRLGGLGGRYPCAVTADGPLEAVRVPDAAFLAAYRRSAEVARSTCELCAARLRGMIRLAGFGRRSAEARLAAILLSLRREHGDTIPATRHSLSLWVGAAQETVFRILARWRRRRLVSTARGAVRILDAAALAEAAEEGA